MKWRPEDLLLHWLQPMSWEDMLADTDERALEAYRAIELSLRLRDAFEAPKLREVLHKLGPETTQKLLAYAWLRYEHKWGYRPSSAWVLRQQTQNLLDNYPCESIKDIIYALKRADGYTTSPQQLMTAYLEWKSIKLEEWHRSFSYTPDSLPAWMAEHCPPHWRVNENPNQGKKYENNDGQAA
ncbi:hypothetical protein HNQ92_002355 [Rhabdobacter roseus]|uniref:Uncharacterized protein n=2 Tax=Rhabdobacter roseus TaxID=1655419 RepID=A0A840TRM8_9BACT|nr:hypothetical protein [Rhabdobacter roseus]